MFSVKKKLRNIYKVFLISGIRFLKPLANVFALTLITKIKTSLNIFLRTAEHNYQFLDHLFFYRLCFHGGTSQIIQCMHFSQSFRINYTRRFTLFLGFSLRRLVTKFQKFQGYLRNFVAKKEKTI